MTKEEMIRRLESGTMTEQAARKILNDLPPERPLPQRASRPFKSPTIARLKEMQDAEDRRNDRSSTVHAHVQYH